MYEMALILVGVAITLIYVAIYARWSEKHTSRRWLNSTKIPIPQGKVVASCRFLTTPKGQLYWMPWEEWVAIISEEGEG